MKYMLLIHNNPQYIAAMSQAEQQALFGRVESIMKELERTGELVGGAALADPSETRTVKVRGGVPAVTDGPFIEAKEQFAGYLTVDVESPERAVEIAASWPDAEYAAMEVRALVHESGAEG
ncbi:YciI family protein [Microbispora sp. RL4-1S]|uniref:YciI family protein n=1 Tax=Microbispora oryzae TaxID=2806554 RepID=A0A941AH94_9ACTN|nr:YciI family protein [Microbispora oryzae]MBP2703841.1 YciI family protein [Microbispora oryzae]